jgi:nucleoside-diphosphate-sugar epimerase
VDESSTPIAGGAVPDVTSVLVAGGAGYVGSVMVPQLLARGYRVTVYDIMFFGRDGLPAHPNLTLIEGDIRDTARISRALEGIDVVLHLACISNDPSFELDEDLSKTINYDCFEPMVIAAKRAGIRRFVYCSTSSVYGVSDEPEVTEDHPLVPLTLYNKYKGLCEPLLFKHGGPGFTCVIIRPATICGYSPRMRLDLTVNILTNLAVNTGKITVFGGAQLRPNLHINDMADVYELMIRAPADRVDQEIFNVGYQNLSIARIAEIVRDVVHREFPERKEIAIETTRTNDPRSYHISSDKIRRVLGYEPKRTVEDAVRDLCRAFKEDKLPDSLENDRYFNVRRMRAIKAV